MTELQGRRAEEGTPDPTRMKGANMKNPRTHLALILSGHYLMEWAVGSVREAKPEEREKYAEWVRERLVYLAGDDHKSVSRHDSPTAGHLANAEVTRREEKMLPVESRVIPISEGERDTILSECRAAEEQRRVAEEREEAETEMRIQQIYAEAARTGEPQVLETGMDECDNFREECSYDAITVYAMPDGTRRISRMHTW